MGHDLHQVEDEAGPHVLEDQARLCAALETNSKINFCFLIY